jgi:mannan endo-1,4-beta-mannosidase
MRKNMVSFLAALFILWPGIISSFAAAQQTISDLVDVRGHHFVNRTGRVLYHQGVPFRIAGADNYYPMYVSQFMVDNLFTIAAANNFNVFRFWGFIDIGNQDGSNCVEGPNCLDHNGIYFHYWNGTEPAFNDGATGLENLDYAVYRAGQLNLKVIIPFVNNWQQFGGMDQYVRWLKGQYHDQFYTDPTIRQWYKDWVFHLLNHTNIYTGIQYKNDATILAWDLANEPRCGGSGVYPTSPSCNTQIITNWAADVSTYVKSIDSIHLLSAGDEGFYCTDPSSSDFTINCSQGVDTLALAKLPNMDGISFHLYPDSWGKTPAWGTRWIRRHIEDSHRLGNRAVLGEFGDLNKARRNPIYKKWEDQVATDNGAGALYWILSGEQDSGMLYPDYDGYTVYCPSPVCKAFTNFARETQNLPVNYSPVADNDTAVTPNDTPVTLNITHNDITYQNVALENNSVDLNPSTPGQQTEFTTAFGRYALKNGGNVRFTPAGVCVSGNVGTPYTVMDAMGRTSNPANIVITIGGIPGQLYNFEDGTDTWTAASFNAAAGTSAQSTLDATSCTHSLQVTVPPNQGGWFGPAYSTPPLPLTLTSITDILMDISTSNSGTSQSVAVQVGNDFHWCQTPFGFVSAGTSTTVTVNLTNLLTSASDCGGSLPRDTSTLQGLWIFFNDGGSGNGGTFYLDNVRSQYSPIW